MKNENNDLLGSLFGTVSKKGSPCVIKNIKKLFRILCRKEHIVQVNLIIINNDHLFEGQIDHIFALVQMVLDQRRALSMCGLDLPSILHHRHWY